MTPNIVRMTARDHRKQRDGGADAGEGDDDLEEGTPERAGVGAGADDEVLGLYRGVEAVCGDRDKGNQVEDARDESGLSGRAHVDSFLAVVYGVHLISQHRKPKLAVTSKAARGNARTLFISPS
jgi:hypothetical protein